MPAPVRSTTHSLPWTRSARRSKRTGATSGHPRRTSATDEHRNCASLDEMAPGRAHTYATPDTLPLNHWALSGSWTANPESVVLHHPKGGISFRFHARDVHLVMGPMDGSTPVAFRVSIDRERLHDASGSDVDDGGAGLLNEPRMYQLVRQRGPIDDRLFTIEFLDRGAEAFAFTFG